LAPTPAAPAEPGAACAHDDHDQDHGFARWCQRMRLPASPAAWQVWRKVAASQVPLHYGKIDL
tara:strand:+ start:924 stop:1112 length:189 start_codon:yes stop_codon:yes gene_type:complete